ncbi:ATP-binding protein [Pyrococcus sp. NA2]|uniref:ATP-binding protein n=1 Tax=Pyrococcus sp. (strain NA2) TaxID=342949 RepID=UPI00064FF3E7|nr:ATP-binding protein [Pyrococcus sp. NA2]
MNLEEVIVEFQKLGIPEVKRRELELPTNLSQAIVVFGLRRTGKTHLLYQTMLSLMEKGLPMERLFYINFEDNRLEGITGKDLSKIVELYYKHNPDADTMYLFLDEVQNVPGWEKFVRRLLERKNARVFITGSSSKLLSKEIATSLRGRSLSFKLFPLSFREFLVFKRFEFREPLIEPERGKIKRYLEEYVEYGGFPEIVDYPPLLKIRTLQEYLDLIIYKDLIERYGIEKTGAMKGLIRVIVRNFARRTSIRKLHGMLSSLGLSLSRGKVYEYFSYLEDIGFVIPVRRFHFSEVESLRSIPKLYIADVGFPTVFGVKDIGHRMENIVALELLRRKHYREPRLNIAYWMDTKGEVDFVVSLGFEVRELIQVSYDVDDPETKRREVEALLRAAKTLKCDNLTVITWDYEAVETHGGKTIKFVPLWMWLLGLEQG